MNNKTNATMKRIFLLMLMLVAMVVSTYAEDVACASLENGVLTFYYGTLKSSATCWKVTTDVPWGTRKSEISKVVFDSSFAQARPTSCSNWFSNCSKLTKIDGMEYLNTSEVTDMYSMFYRCGALTTIDVSHFNTSKVKSFSMMFQYDNIANLDVSNFDTSSAEDMSGMFMACSSLVNLDVSGFNTSKVKNMSAMFYACKNLKSIDISHFKTSVVERMSDMFYNCSSLDYLDLSNFETSNVTDMSRMFSGCSLTNLDVSSFDVSNVLDMSCMFQYCDKLTTIYSNKSWSCEKSSSMFAHCDNLKGVIAYDAAKTDVSYANIESGYFTAPYGLTICGVSITGVNSNQINTIEGVSGTASYDHESKTLTLTDCSISYSGGVAIKSEIDSLNVRLVGNNGILAATGLESSSDFTILGDGQLTILATTGINMTNSMRLGELAICDGAKVNIVAGETGISGACYKAVTPKIYRKTFRVSGGSTDVVIFASTAAVADMNKLVLKDGLALTAPTGAQFKNHAVCDADGNVIANKTVRISLLGDANGDGSITMADANMVVNYFLATNKSDIQGFDLSNANANGDADEDGQPSITMADANKIVNMFLNGAQ